MTEYELTQEEKEFVAMWIAEYGHFRLDQTANAREIGVEYESGSKHLWFIRESDPGVAMQKRRAFEIYAKKIQLARAWQWMKTVEEMGK